MDSNEPHVEIGEEQEQAEMDPKKKAKLISKLSHTLADVAKSLRELGDLPEKDEDV